MRRSDEEFKAELRARVRQYRAAREKRRVAALKTVSAVMAACLLVVVVSQVDFSWIGRNPDSSTEDASAEEKTLSGEENEFVGMEESLTTEGETKGSCTETQGNAEAPESLPGNLGDLSSGNDEATKAVTSISFKLSSGVNWEGAEGDDTERYEGSEEAERLSAFLNALSESLLKPEGVFGPSENSSAEEWSKEKYEIAVRYSDGTRMICSVVQGMKTGWLTEDTMVLDEQDWSTLMELLDLVRETKTSTDE